MWEMKSGGSDSCRPFSSAAQPFSFPPLVLWQHCKKNVELLRGRRARRCVINLCLSILSMAVWMEGLCSAPVSGRCAFASAAHSLQCSARAVAASAPDAGGAARPPLCVYCGAHAPAAADACVPRFV